MERIESLLMQAARILGVIIMGVVLLAIVVMGLGKFFSGIGSLFEKDLPEVEFYKSDFAEPAQKANLDSDQKRPPGAAEKDVDEFFAEIMPKYKKVVANYARDKEDLNQTSLSDSFEQQSRNYFAYSVDFSWSAEEEASEQRAAFLEGLEDYLNEADENSILVYTQKNWEGKDIPIGSINQSKAFQVYRQEFLAQMKEIKQRKDEEGLTGLLKNVAFYMALFAGIFTYLMIALLFSILRIEKHMAARSSR